MPVSYLSLRDLCIQITYLECWQANKFQGTVLNIVNLQCNPIKIIEYFQGKEFPHPLSPTHRRKHERQPGVSCAHHGADTAENPGSGAVRFPAARTWRGTALVPKPSALQFCAFFVAVSGFCPRSPSDLAWCTLISVGGCCYPLGFVLGMQGMPELPGCPAAFPGLCLTRAGCWQCLPSVPREGWVRSLGPVVPAELGQCALLEQPPAHQTRPLLLFQRRQFLQFAF